MVLRVRTVSFLGQTRSIGAFPGRISAITTGDPLGYVHPNLTKSDQKAVDSVRARGGFSKAYLPSLGLILSKRGRGSHSGPRVDFWGRPPVGAPNRAEGDQDKCTACPQDQGQQPFKVGHPDASARSSRGSSACGGRRDRSGRRTRALHRLRIQILGSSAP